MKLTFMQRQAFSDGSANQTCFHVIQQQPFYTISEATFRINLIYNITILSQLSRILLGTLTCPGIAAIYSGELRYIPSHLIIYPLASVLTPGGALREDRSITNPLALLVENLIYQSDQEVRRANNSLTQRHLETLNPTSTSLLV